MVLRAAAAVDGHRRHAEPPRRQRRARRELDGPHGIPTVTFGAGQNDIHTVDEWVDLDEFDRACALAVQLATTR